MRFSPIRPLQSSLALLSAVFLATLASPPISAQTQPLVTNYAAASQNATITITGQNFGTTPGTVTVDGAPATVVQWTDTGITVDLAPSAGPGTLDITTAAGIAASFPFNGVERGFYTLSSNGTVSSSNGLPTYGDLSTLGVAGTSPAIQLIPTANDQGYWILTQNGTVYNFGDAASLGAVGSPITAVSMAVLPSGSGAWVLSNTGAVYALGQAANYGSAPSGVPATAIAATADGNGYWVLAANGSVYPFGDAANLGSASVTSPSAPGSTSYRSGTLARVGKTALIFLVKGSTVYHIPNIAVLKGLGDKIGNVRTVPNLNGYTLGPPMIAPYPDGTVLQCLSNNTAYLLQGGLVHPLASPSLVAASHIPSSQVVSVPSIAPNWPLGPTIANSVPYVPNGSLYRAAKSKTIYLLDNGSLDSIASAAVFNGMGLKWSKVQTVSTLPPYPQGSPLTVASLLAGDGSLWRVKGTVYVDESGIMRHIPSAKLFNSLGFHWSAVNNVPSLGSFKVGSDLGSTTIPAGQAPPTTAVDLVPTANSQGYWVLLQDGQIDALGNAASYGNPSASQRGSASAISLAPTPDGQGYTILASNGQAFSYGDALPAPSLTTGATSLAASALALSTPSVPSTPTPGFFSMAYGSFMPHYDGSYSTLVNDAQGLSAIIPTWYYDQQNPNTLAWGIGSPPQGSSAVVAQAHSEGVQVWPMVGSISVGPFQNPGNIGATVTQLVNTAVQNNYDGITLDFEPSQFNGLTLAQAAQQFANFAAQLGPALHSVGKKLMVDTYSSFYPNSPYNLPQLGPSVDYFNIMSYGHFDDATQAGPDASLGWMTSIYQSALADGVNPRQIIMGFGPYGDYWSFNNSGIDQQAPLGSDSYVSDAQVAQLLASNSGIVPVWDPTLQSETFMTNAYVNAQGQWTVNPSGQAVAPTQTFDISDQATVNPQIKNLQGLLNYILLRYAVENNQAVPSFLNLIQDGKYGSATQAAVTQFQQDFKVAGATAGVYDAATQAALTQVIQSWGLGEYQYWVDTTQSMQNRVQQVAEADNLAGMAIWRLPFETSDFWTTLENTVTVQHPTQGGN